MEAFHNRHHPLLIRIKSIVDSGELGSVKEVHARMQFPWLLSRFLDPDTSIHWDPSFGGGNLLEAGCYCVNAIRFASASEPASIENAAPLGIIPGKAETGLQYAPQKSAPSITS
jgi:predicted dehydrogenase